MADTIPYWGAFAGQQFDYDPSQTAAGRQFLDAIRKYDPNAQFVAHSRGGEGGSGQSFYQLSIDPTKVPWNQRQVVDVNANAYDPLYNSPMDSGYSTGHGFDMSQLYDPTAIRNDSVLGNVTDAKNVRPDSGTWLDKVGPLAVAAFAFGIPSIASAMSGGAIGGSTLSGLDAATDPFLNGGTGAMDMTGSYGTGIPGSLGANAPVGSAESSLYGTLAQTDPVAAYGGSPLINQPLGSAESSLYGPSVLDDPASALGGGTQAAAPIIDQGTAAGIGDVLRNGGIPGLDNLLTSGGSLLSGLSKIPGLGNLSGGGSGSGNTLLGLGGGNQRPITYDNLTSILGRFYGGKKGLLNG